ncbi:RHS repeat-associated core domain-containing protein [Pseudovibrio sp. Tun.PSC04-5.I4]|uniref:RHS repeat domain-containing protein n=1 Tax=Pseudovibrio sp. Tun.PSC04-5.I4 TaxID=1798213 RepID=UPI00088D458B|nr:RHS repeat-associated core domain-containing protein [Pseudovibrio sp. Tun.PSC04-5.I4]SDR48460.1 RHS repeat-associated core domain-containing protein [Pseudovibrio sp. Tun.PSC04-5.I4]
MPLLQYRGSQAFNQTLQVNEFVNKNTGSLFVQIPLVQLRGKTEAIGLGLSLFYASGTTGQLGLPAGWGYNLPYVANDETFTFQGKTFIIDPDWTDSSGYQSGLKYLNDHGRKFEKFLEDQQLPTGVGTYRYLFIYNDGAKSYLDATGKLVLHADLFGNALRYTYADQLGDVFDNTLASIVDSYGQTVSLGYDLGTLIIVLPDGSTQEVAYSDQGVFRVTNQIGVVTEIEYGSHTFETVISNISYASGLITTLAYTSIEYLEEDGSTGSFPAVRLLRHSNFKNEFLDATQYAYGSASDGNTFTGFTHGYRLSPSGDGLMNSENTAYLYDVLVERLDASGAFLSVSRVFYNFLHSPVRSYSYLLDEDGYSVDAYRSLYEYRIVADQHDRSINMGKPISVVHSVFDPSTDSWSDYKKIETEYNDFGHITLSRKFDLTGGSGTLVNETTQSYVAVDWGGELPLEKVELDKITGKQVKSTYTLTDDDKNISQVTLAEKEADSDQFVSTKTKRFFYDDAGAQDGWQLSWAEGHSSVAGALTSVSSRFAQNYDTSTGQLTILTTDANGGVNESVFDMRLPMAPRIRQTTPEGKVYSFSYDAVGRVTSILDPLGQTKTYTYTMAFPDRATPDLAKNTVQTHNKNGYELRTTFDALGRSVLLEDNGDPTQTAPELNRQLAQITYNALGQISEDVGMTGQTARYQYDALGREVSRIDHLGNEYTLTYDDPNQNIQSLLNDRLRARVQYDGLGQALVIESYPYSATQAMQYYQHTYSYNGFGLPETVSTYSVENGVQTHLSTTNNEYNSEGVVVRETFIGTAAEALLQADVETVTSYDLLGNPVQLQRIESYNNVSQPEVKTALLTYDAMGNLVSAANQLGQLQIFSYNTDNEVTSYQRHDGVTTNYIYDAIGQLATAETGGARRLFSYLSNGLVSQVSEGSQSIRYEYSLDGTAAAIHYADGKSVTLSKDAFSRVVSYTLPDGTQSFYSYNDTNQLLDQTTDNVSLRNTWGIANNQHGALLNQILEDPALPSQTTDFTYDGYGHPEQIAVSDGNGANVLTTNATRDIWRNVTNLTISSQSNRDAAVNVAKTMSYNGLHQLISSQDRNLLTEEVFSETYKFDGAGNILAYTRNDQTQQFQYNAINQLISDGITYDRNGRMLKDVDGTTYSYDVTGRLVRADLPDGTQTQYTYDAEGALASVATNEANNRFYTVADSVASVTSEALQDGDQESSHAVLWSNTLPYAQLSEASSTLYSRTMNSVRLHNSAGGSESIDISDYGSITTPTALTPPNSLNWEGQFTDASTELTYLHARWYSPKSMRFLSPDPLFSINTYGYANGNPISYFDPTGLTTKEAAVFVLALAVGIAVGALAGGAVGAGVAVALGTESVWATIAASSAAGAAGAVAGDIAASGVTGEDVTGRQIEIDLISGALGGAAGAGAEHASGSLVERSLVSNGAEASVARRHSLIFSGAIGGAADAAVAGGVASIAYNQPFFSGENMLDIGLGGALGFRSGYVEAKTVIGDVLPARTSQDPSDPGTSTDASGRVLDEASLNSALPDVDANQISTRPRSNAMPVKPLDKIKAAIKFRGIGGIVHSRPQVHAPNDVVQPASHDAFAQNLASKMGNVQSQSPLLLVRGNFNDAQKIAESIQSNILKVTL